MTWAPRPGHDALQVSSLDKLLRTLRARQSLNGIRNKASRNRRCRAQVHFLSALCLAPSARLPVRLSRNEPTALVHHSTLHAPAPRLPLLTLVPQQMRPARLRQRARRCGASLLASNLRRRAPGSTRGRSAVRIEGWQR